MRHCTKMYRIINPDESIGLIRADETMINHCAMPYAISRTTTLERVIIPDQFLTRWNADLFIDEAERIDPKDKMVACAEDLWKRLK